MPTNLTFRLLSEGWNADPNSPEPVVTSSGHSLLLRFSLNYFLFEQFAEGDVGILRFVDCSRYRLGETNDEGWYRGQCRYSRSAPAWGEFYELSGDDPHLEEPKDWRIIATGKTAGRHFLFYLRDHTFECIAADWAFEPSLENALFRHFQTR
jgi:hypothetical protein